MVKYAMVGVACAIVGGLVGWAVHPGTDVRPDHPAPPANRPTPPRRAGDTRASEPAEPAALVECKRALVQQRAELRLVRDAAARASEERVDEDEDGVGPAGTAPSGPSRDAPPDGAGSSTDPSSERQRARAATEKVRDTVVDHLGVTEDEQQVIKDLVCTQRENVRGLYDDLGEGRLDAEAFVQALSQERTLASEGLRRSLGSRRYRRFRELGAIGLLAPVLCKKR